jgi:hypothetical protein
MMQLHQQLIKTTSTPVAAQPDVEFASNLRTNQISWKRQPSALHWAKVLAQDPWSNLMIPNPIWIIP